MVLQLVVGIKYVRPVAHAKQIVIKIKDELKLAWVCFFVLLFLFFRTSFDEWLRFCTFFFGYIINHSSNFFFLIKKKGCWNKVQVTCLEFLNYPVIEASVV